MIKIGQKVKFDPYDYGTKVTEVRERGMQACCS